MRNTLFIITTSLVYLIAASEFTKNLESSIGVQEAVSLKELPNELIGPINITVLLEANKGPTYYKKPERIGSLDKTALVFLGESYDSVYLAAGFLGIPANPSRYTFVGTPLFLLMFTTIKDPAWEPLGKYVGQIIFYDDRKGFKFIMK
jgi:hypothetical protein